MNLNNTRLGKLANELNNFINVVNPSVIADLEKMRPSDLEKLASSNSLTGLVAKQYIALLQYFSFIIDESKLEPVMADLDIPEEERYEKEEEVKEKKSEVKENKKLKLSDSLEQKELKTEELNIEDLELKEETFKKQNFEDIDLPKHLQSK